MAEMTLDFGSGSFHVFTAITGTSTNSYPGTAQAEWKKAYNYNGYKTITIEEDGGANGITAKVAIKPSPNDTFTGLVKDDNGADEPAIAASAFALFNIPEACHTIEVFIKSTVGGSHGTFKIIAAGYTTGAMR